MLKKEDKLWIETRGLRKYSFEACICCGESPTRLEESSLLSDLKSIFNCKHNFVLLNPVHNLLRAAKFITLKHSKCGISIAAKKAGQSSCYSTCGLIVLLIGNSWMEWPQCVGRWPYLWGFYKRKLLANRAGASHKMSCLTLSQLSCACESVFFKCSHFQNGMKVDLN